MQGEDEAPVYGWEVLSPPPETTRPSYPAPAETPTDDHSYISPVLLNQQWSKIGRLLAQCVAVFISSIFAMLFVSSFFVEETLTRLGNVYLACTGLSDLIVTSVILPVATVLLLATEWNTIPMCHFLHYMAVFSTYTYSLFFFLNGLENYLRLCGSSEQYHRFIHKRVDVVCCVVIVVGALLAYLDVYAQLDYDYCQRRHYGNFGYRISITVMFHAVPAFVTLYGLISSLRSIGRRARAHNLYKRSRLYKCDHRLTLANTVAFLAYVLAWTPYMTVSFLYPDATSKTYYYTAWTGLARSIISSWIFCICNFIFRSTYRQLLSYCCCRHPMNAALGPRNSRPEVQRIPLEGVSTHIMHQVLNNASPQRAASTSRDPQII